VVKLNLGGSSVLRILNRENELVLARFAGLAGACGCTVPVLLGFSQGAHLNIMLFEPAGDGIGITPLIFFLTVDARNFDSTELFLHILLSQPVFILIERLCSQTLSHGLLPTLHQHHSKLSFPSIVILSGQSSSDKSESNRL
jgi:hypothetical protein